MTGPYATHQDKRRLFLNGENDVILFDRAWDKKASLNARPGDKFAVMVSHRGDMWYYKNRECLLRCFCGRLGMFFGPSFVHSVRGFSRVIIFLSPGLKWEAASEGIFL